MHHHHHSKMPIQAIRFVRMFSLVLLVCSIAVTPGLTAAADNKQQAAQAALQKAGGGGKVLSVSTETDRDGRQVFAVKVLSNGRVRVIRIPRS